MTNDNASVTRTILIRTSDGAGKAYTYVNTRPNLAFRLAMLVGLIVGIALLVLVIIPFSIILILALFLLEIIKRAVIGARSLLENAGVISSKEGRKNVRVVDR